MQPLRLTAARDVYIIDSMTKLTPTKNPRTMDNPLTKELAAAVKHAAQIEETARAERERLERALKLARGTGDVTEKARAASTSVSGRAIVIEKSRTLADNIEHALRAHGVLLESALARTLGVTPPKLSAEMRRLASAHKVYNIGSEEHPRWCWIIGDDSSPAELNQQVYRLTSAAPLTFAQLEAATGARRGRVSGAIVAMQRNPKIAKRIENLGNGRVFVWFVRPDKHDR